MYNVYLPTGQKSSKARRARGTSASIAPGGHNYGDDDGDGDGDGDGDSDGGQN